MAQYDFQLMKKFINEIQFQPAKNLPVCGNCNEICSLKNNERALQQLLKRTPAYLCSNPGCNRVFENSDELEYHFYEVCDNRKINCPYLSCNQMVNFKNLKEHLNEVHKKTLRKIVNNNGNNFAIAHSIQWQIIDGQSWAIDGQTWTPMEIQTRDGSIFYTSAKMVNNTLYFWINILGRKGNADNFR